jgi:hypothetical protein
MPDDSHQRFTHIAGCLKWPSIAAVLIVGLLCLTILRSVDKLGSTLGFLHGAGTQQTVVDSFRENVRQVTGTQGDILELATLEADETFTRMDSKSLAWKMIDLGTTISEIRAPAVYRYHLKLSDQWTVNTQGRTCVIIAPKILPTLPPAIRTDRMEKKSQAGWARFNSAENLSELEKSITPTLERRAGNPTHIASIREPARLAVAQFAKAWLLRHQEQLAIDKIVVAFIDEPAAKDAAAISKLPTTLDLVQ